MPKNRAFDHSKYQNWIDPHEVTEYQNNAKKHDDRQVKNIANSIRRFGWQQDTVLTSDNVLVIGHGRRLAALEIGCEMPYHRIDKNADELTDKDIRELRIADNQTNAETGFDLEIRDMEIGDLDFSGFDFDFSDPFDGGNGGGQTENDNQQPEHGSLKDKFLVPPFSVLRGDSGNWITRKRIWQSLGLRSELGRG